MLHFLGEHRFSRSDVVVALGGGVVGDLAGFAAATYQRGMGFAQIPTTLLAAVDSSVGGKTAVDLPTGKNQAGSFYQPCIVICDPNTLETLPEEQYRCGCAEIIKYSMLGNAAFFEELYKTPVREQYEHVIEVCVQMKRDIVGALGAQAVFHREGRLPQRPLAPLDSVLKEHGMTLREDGDLLYCSGQLIGGNYTIAGNVSSQYISGLLMALPLLIRDSLLMVSGPLESAAYVAMTEDALQLSKLTIPKMGAMWAIPGQQRCHLPKRTVVEGDWSNTAFFLCMGALSKEGVTVEGLNLQSSQGDRGVLDVLRRFGAEVTEHGDAVTVRRGTLHGVMIDAAPIPDLIPVLSVVASVAEGETRVENAYRLRLKESDRLKSTANLLRALGGRVEEKEDGLVITGVPALHGGAVETQNDHRLAMSAATAACAATGEITVDNDGCVAKSYPRFWEDFSSLKGEGL